MLFHKMREAMQDEYDNQSVEGEVEVVVAVRARRGRTLTFVTRNESDCVDLVARHVKPGSIIYADEASHWDHLSRGYAMGRINHEEAYSNLEGTQTNMAESFFSRLRRMVRGQHHFVSPRYLHQCESHATWLENHRRDDNGVLAHLVVRNCLAAPVSRVFAGCPSPGILRQIAA